MTLSRKGRSARLLEPFHHPKSRRLLSAFLTSELGDGITHIVIPLGVYAATNDIVALAGTFLGRLLLSSVFAAAGGAVADRWDRRGILLLSYLVRALLVTVLVLMPAEADGAFVALGILVGASGSFDNPSAEASLRSVYRHDLQSLAAARKTGKSFSALVGPAVGALLFGLGGVELALGVNIAAFLIALVILYPTSPLPPSGHSDPNTVGGSRETFALRNLPRVPAVVKLAFASTFAGSFLVGLSVVVAVPYLDSLDQAPPGAYGFAIAAYSAGALSGLYLAGIADWHRVSLKTILVAANFAYGLLVVFSVALPFWQIFAFAWILWGIAFGPEDVVADARVAAVISDQWLGRIYSWWTIMGKLGSGAAFSVAICFEDADYRMVLLVAGLVYAVFVPLCIVGTVHPFGRSRSVATRT